MARATKPGHVEFAEGAEERLSGCRASATRSIVHECPNAVADIVDYWDAMASLFTG